MREVFLNKSISIIEKHYKNYSSDELEKIRYGLEGIYLTIFKFLIIIIFSMFAGIFKEVVAVLLSYNVLRYFAFGLHARNSIECLILSIVFFIVFPYLMFSGILVIKFSVLIYLLSIIGFLLFAPSDTVKRPLLNKKKRLIRKIAVLLVILTYFVLSHFILGYFWDLVLITATIIELIMINPFTYKIFGQPYNNYIKYQL